MGFGPEPKKLVVEGVVEHVPPLAPEELAVHPNRGAKADFQVRHPVPRFTEGFSCSCHAPSLAHRRDAKDTEKNKSTLCALSASAVNPGLLPPQIQAQEINGPVGEDPSAHDRTKQQQADNAQLGGSVSITLKCLSQVPSACAKPSL